MSTLTPTPLPDLIINEIHADPADGLDGDANGDGIPDPSDDEFIEIVNTTDRVIDLIGWEIHDLTEVRHVFTGTTFIPAECAIVVFGGGLPTGDFGGALVQISSTGMLGLNNPGDTLTLKDINGDIIDLHTYGSEGSHDQSITRDPDIVGPNPMVEHSEANGSGGALFSPGMMIDGTIFIGCAPQATLKQHHRSGLQK